MVEFLRLIALTYRTLHILLVNPYEHSPVKALLHSLLDKS